MDAPPLVDWSDYDFVADAPPEPFPEPDFDRTGWELIVFDLEDDDWMKSRDSGPRTKD